MFHDLSLLDDEHLVFLAVVVAIVASSMAWIITALGVQCRRWRQSRQTLAFKRDMIARGLSVAQVERLLIASPRGQLARLTSGALHAAALLSRRLGGLLRRVLIACQWGGVRRQQQELQFKARLVDQGWSVGEIERLYQAQLPGWPARLATTVEHGLTQLCLWCRRFGQSVRTRRETPACSS